jgi:hypothetical protein
MFTLSLGATDASLAMTSSFAQVVYHLFKPKIKANFSGPSEEN